MAIHTLHTLKHSNYVLMRAITTAAHLFYRLVHKLHASNTRLVLATGDLPRSKDLLANIIDGRFEVIGIDVVV